MPLLADYAITPDVFDATSYPTAGECEAWLQTIRETMLTEGLVRDLRAGEWAALFRSDDRPWHPRGTELVKKLTEQGRLVRHESERPGSPPDDRGWCDEALAGHATRPFTGGVIVTESVKSAYAKNPLVSRIDRLAGAPWWAARSPSVTLSRTLGGYETQLDLVLRCSNSIIFIDAHLDPEKHRYRDFGELLSRAGGRTPAPRIEVHRVCYEGSGPQRRFPMRDDPNYFEHRFGRLAAPLRRSGLSAEVFIWDDFHDRYLISNLIGIALSNGFDTNNSQSTTWHRLGRLDRDNVRREFHPRTGPHKLQARSFKIP